MKTYLTAAIAFACATIATAGAEDAPHTLDEIAFLEGTWRGGEGFVFEEIWSAPGGGVMTGMARGYEGETLRVLEYIVVAETSEGLEMRFKHFNADYSTWEDDGPVTLRLTAVTENDVTFSADPPSETVKSIRYWQPSEGTLQADVIVVEDDVEGGFSLKFSSVNSAIAD